MPKDGEVVMRRQHKEDQKLIAKYGVLYDHFKPRFWWWEVQVSKEKCVCVCVCVNLCEFVCIFVFVCVCLCVYLCVCVFCLFRFALISCESVQVIVRRILILVVYVALYTKVTQRTYGIAVLSLLCLIVHTQCNPFKGSDDNALESLSLLMLAYAAITKIAYQDGGEFACVCVCVCVCVCMCVCVCVPVSTHVCLCPHVCSFHASAQFLTPLLSQARPPTACTA
jgi:hypothetical protein